MTYDCWTTQNVRESYVVLDEKEVPAWVAARLPDLSEQERIVIVPTWESREH